MQLEDVLVGRLMFRSHLLAGENLGAPDFCVTQAGGDVLVHEASDVEYRFCLLYTSPSPRDRTRSRMPSSA